MVLFSFCLDLVVIGICCIFAVKKEYVFSIVGRAKLVRARPLFFYVQLAGTLCRVVKVIVQKLYVSVK